MQRLLSSGTSCLRVKRVVLGSAVGLPGCTVETSQEAKPVDAKVAARRTRVRFPPPPPKYSFKVNCDCKPHCFFGDKAVCEELVRLSKNEVRPLGCRSVQFGIMWRAFVNRMEAYALRLVVR